MYMEESLRLSHQPEMDYNEDIDDDDENMTWEALTSANSLVDVAIPLRYRVGTEQDNHEEQACLDEPQRALTLTIYPSQTFSPTALQTSTQPTKYTAPLFFPLGAWDRHIDSAEHGRARQEEVARVCCERHTGG